ncbi:MAG: serpin family protein [Candidatus Sumerlaeia bacterium]
MGLVETNNRFACDLYARLRGEPGNLFFSPYSVASALAMVYAGARGRTAAEMEQVLLFDGGQKVHAELAKLAAKLSSGLGGGVELNVANSLWPNLTLQPVPEYVALVNQYYETAITPIDYSKPLEACAAINRWVAEKTDHKIEGLIDEVDPLTDLVLVNAIYFKGQWAIQFDPRMTFDQEFKLSRDESVHAPLMFVHEKYGHAQVNGAQILEMPYLGRRFSMVFILPDEIDGLAEIEARLNAQTLGAWIKAMDETKVVVVIPRFKLAWGTFDLTGTLKRMGMRAAFEQPDFSGMCPTPLALNKVLHKAFVEVNEEGTEAAAATAAMMLRGGGPVDPQFIADHPFLFLIRDKSTGGILFMGRVMDPGKGE